jgi:transcriptional regulator with XRE-family HTH domain
LRDILHTVNMSQTELANRSGISRQMIVKYISGSAPMPLEKAKTIAQVLNCNMEDLYEWVE